MNNGINGENSNEDPQDTVSSDRGSYFSNKNSLITIPQELSFPKSSLSEFSVIFWLYLLPDSFSDTEFLFSSSLNSSFSQSFILLNSSLVIEDNFSPDQSMLKATQILKRSSWQMLRLLLQPNQVEIWVNSNLEKVIPSPFYLFSTSFQPLYIGGKPSEFFSIKTFIWNFLIINKFILSEFFTDSVNGCTVGIIENSKFFCPSENFNLSKTSSGKNCEKGCRSCSDFGCLTCECPSKSCIFKENQKKCLCPSTAFSSENHCICPSGYFFQDFSCKSCQVPNCFTCEDEEKCLKCEEGFNLESSSCKCRVGFRVEEESCEACSLNCKKCSSKVCIECMTGFFIRELACEPCGNGCEKCEEGKCLECKTNFFMKKSGECQCPRKGFSQDGLCRRNFFTAEIRVSEGNVVNLFFNESLKKPLERKDFQVKVMDLQQPSVKFRRISNELYRFFISSTAIIDENAFVQIIVKKSPLFSTQESLYLQSELKAHLLFNDPFITSARDYIQKTSLKGLEFSLTVAVISGFFYDFAFFWGVFSSFQIVSYLPMNCLNYSENFRGFFKELNVVSRLSKYFDVEYGAFFEMNGKGKYFMENYWQKYDLPEVSILIYLFIFGAVLAIFSYLGKKVLKGRIQSFFSSIFFVFCYKYPIRLFLSCSVDIGIYSFKQLFNLPSEDLNFHLISLIILHSLFILAIFLSPIFLTVLTYKNREKIMSPLNPEFNLKWSTFYQDFRNSNGFLSTQFFTIFLIRRSIFLISQIFLGPFPEFQITLNISSSMLEFFFIFIYFPFKRPLIMISKSFSEFSILSIQVLIMTLTHEPQDPFKENLELTVNYLIYFLVLVQALLACCDLLISLKLFKNKLKLSLQSRKPAEINSIQDSFDQSSEKVFQESFNDFKATFNN